jgi:hypothetical protein
MLGKGMATVDGLTNVLKFSGKDIDYQLRIHCDDYIANFPAGFHVASTCFFALQFLQGKEISFEYQGNKIRNMRKFIVSCNSGAKFKQKKWTT